MNKAHQLRELENRAKNAIEALFLALQGGRETGSFKSILEASIDAAEALTRRRTRKQP